MSTLTRGETPKQPTAFLIILPAAMRRVCCSLFRAFASFSSYSRSSASISLRTRARVCSTTQSFARRCQFNDFSARTGISHRQSRHRLLRPSSCLSLPCPAHPSARSKMSIAASMSFPEAVSNPSVHPSERVTLTVPVGLSIMVTFFCSMDVYKCFIRSI